jgi:hypothetical protein
LPTITALRLSLKALALIFAAVETSRLSWLAMKKM